MIVLFSASLKILKRTPDLLNALSRYMNINRNDPAGTVSQQLLDLAQISHRFKQECGIIMP